METWAGKFDYILSCIGFAVGLGNLWRFPYLCYRNGGAVFLIPYLTMVMCISLPMIFLESSLGQFASKSCTTIWKISPLFRGVGFCMIMVDIVVVVYYNVIIAWSIYFIYSSMSATLPWSTCDNLWNTIHCTTDHYKTDLNETLLNISSNYNESMANKTLPSQEFWERNALQLSSGIDDMGSICWGMFASLLVAWIFVFLCLFYGIRTSGRVVYVTATLPYLVSIIKDIVQCTRSLV